jgi:UDP-glucose 4-epimerase
VLPPILSGVRYLVTGGAGFIGSHLAEALVGRGCDVVALDNLATGSKRNLEALENDPRFSLVVGSILDADAVDRLVSECDVVVHLAAALVVRRIVEEPLDSIRTNIRGTENVLESAHRHSKKALVASTSEVYGRNPGVMHEDADRILGPTTISRWSYSASKAIDEHLAFGYWVQHEVPTIVARFFNTVGPRQAGGPYGMVLPRFVAQALLDREITIHGDGTQTRCFCDVTDVVRAVVGLVDDDAAIGDVFNIGSDEEISIADLAQRIKEETGSSSPVRNVAYAEVYGNRFEDIPRRVPDVSKIGRLLGWAPRHDLNAIIKRAIDHAHEVGPETLLGGDLS